MHEQCQSSCGGCWSVSSCSRLSWQCFFSSTFTSSIPGAVFAISNHTLHSTHISGNQSSVLSMSLQAGQGREFWGLRLFDPLLTLTLFRCSPNKINSWQIFNFSLVQDSYRKERKLALRHRELDHLGALFSTILTSDSGHSETAAVKSTAEESSGEASESGEEGDGDVGEEAGGEMINNKIWEEIESMPQEFETFKEKWKKSNDSDIEAVSTLSSTLDQMKERLASMQVQPWRFTKVTKRWTIYLQELLRERDQTESSRLVDTGAQVAIEFLKKELPIFSFLWNYLTISIKGKQDQDPDCEHDRAAGAGDCEQVRDGNT